MAGKHTLKKEQRVKSRKLIDGLFKKGRSFSVFPYRILYALQPLPGPALQAGFAASSKGFKRAVDRNRIKRLTREAYRTQSQELEKMIAGLQKRLAVFFIFTGKELPNYDLVQVKISLALQQLIIKLNEGGPSST